MASEILICWGQTASQLRQPTQALGHLSFGSVPRSIGAMNPPPDYRAELEGAAGRIRERMMAMVSCGMMENSQMTMVLRMLSKSEQVKKGMMLCRIHRSKQSKPPRKEVAPFLPDRLLQRTKRFHLSGADLHLIDIS